MFDLRRSDRVFSYQHVVVTKGLFPKSERFSFRAEAKVEWLQFPKVIKDFPKYSLFWPKDLERASARPSQQLFKTFI